MGGLAFMQKDECIRVPGRRVAAETSCVMHGLHSATHRIALSDTPEVTAVLKAVVARRGLDFVCEVGQQKELEDIKARNTALSAENARHMAEKASLAYENACLKEGRPYPGREPDDKRQRTK